MRLDDPRHNGRLGGIGAAVGGMQDGKRLGACRIVLRKAAGDHAAKGEADDGGLVYGEVVEEVCELV